ncbi:alternative ribosome rescue aminoacyl-tRNA hydrolase ArfB [Nocardioides limicola]|uniref:alternative ribosome rescue aminoacyl-tRNA hydrolase ArfB n=1 Tax=Nocardioides limicola TaxID=2803368 RepID=UPI00193AED0D|nr:alternative ribosome rescue aminoacyl-tRNA hydrolase ArfB [Nocardioides sp. DJM-14]
MTVPGADLALPAGPGIPSGLVIPAAELTERFSRSPGPGGQSVNTSDTRVELVYAVSASAALSDSQREQVLRRLADRLVDGTLVVTASEHRSQHRNRVAARERLSRLLREALAPPAPPRRPTRPTAGSQRRRVAAKKRRSATKTLRGRVRGDE